MASFNKYQAAVKALPGSWSSANTAAAGAKESFVDIAAALMAQNELLGRAHRALEKTHTTAHGISGAFRSTAGYIHRIERSVVVTTERLLKWGTLLGGIVGVGGLMGIERLTGAANVGRRESMGLGIPYGTLQAFQGRMGRYIDPTGFLGGIASGTSDVTSDQYRALAGLGVNMNQDTGEIALSALPRIQRLLQNTPQAALGPMMQATGLSSLMSVQEGRTLRNTPQSELAQQIRLTRQNAAAMQLPANVLKDMQDLDVQLNLAGRAIRIALIEGLSRVAPQLTRLSEAFAGVITAFLKSDTVKKWLDEAAVGLEHFAKYIAAPEFKSDVEHFISNVGSMATAIGSFVGKMNDILSPSTASATGGSWGALVGAGVGFAFGGLPGAAIGSYGGYKFGSWLGGAGEVGHSRAIDPNSPWSSGAIPRAGGFGAWGEGIDVQLHRAAIQGIVGDFMKMGWTKEQAEGIAANIWSESGGTPWAGHLGSYGIAQWDTTRAAKFKEITGKSLYGSSLGEQEWFLNWELEHGDAQSREGGALLHRSRYPGTSAAIVSKYVERPKHEQEEMDRRARLGDRIHNLSQRQSRLNPPNRPSVDIRNSTGGSAIVTGAGLGAAYG